MFSAAGTSHKNMAPDRAINKVVTMDIIMLMHTLFRCPGETFPLVFGQCMWTIMYGSTIGYLRCSLAYLILRYVQVQSLTQCQKRWGTVMFEFFLSIFGTKVVYSYSENSAVVWVHRNWRGVNMGFSNMHSKKFGLVIKLLNCSITHQYHTLFHDVLYTVVRSTATDPEVWIILVKSSISRLKVILDQ